MDSFNLFLSTKLSGIDGCSTNFMTDLNDSRLNKDNFEVALAQISFSDTETINMGTLNFTSYIDAASKPNVTILKIEAKMGERYDTIFERLSLQIEEIHLKNEFERRKHLRAKNVIKESEIFYNDTKSGIDYNIILPNKDDTKLDELVYEQIKLLTPTITLEYGIDVLQVLRYTLLHKLNSRNHVINYNGSIIDYIPLFKDKIFNEVISGGPQHVILDSVKAPDLSLLYLETDIIEPNYYFNKNMKVLRYFSTETQSTPQLIDFTSCLEYKQLSYEESNERGDGRNGVKRPDSINIYLRDNNFNKIYLNQGTITVNLHFRKK